MSDTNYTLTSDICYVPDGHHLQKLDLYRPKSSTSSTHSSSSSTLYPLVIYIHGGAFAFGSKVSELLPLRFLSHPQNYAIASLDYRLSGDAIFPAAIQDCLAAVKFLHTNAKFYNLDGTRFAVMGESAGGYLSSMTALLSTHPDPSIPKDFGFDHLLTTSTTTPTNSLAKIIKGAITFYGPTDFSLMDTQAATSVPDTDFKHDAADSPESKFLGEQITEIPALVQKANPVRYVEGNVGAPRFFVAHGTKDRIVPFGQSEILWDALRRLRSGKGDFWWPVEGVDHVWGGIREEQRRELDEKLDAFLREVFETAS